VRVRLFAASQVNHCQRSSAGVDGFTLEQMIELLNDGLTVATLLELIACRLHGAPLSREFSLRSHWVM